jgi:hypothetical protein
MKDGCFAPEYLESMGGKSNRTVRDPLWLPVVIETCAQKLFPGGKASGPPTYRITRRRFAVSRTPTKSELSSVPESTRKSGESDEKTSCPDSSRVARNESSGSSRASEFAFTLVMQTRAGLVESAGRIAG